MFDPYTPLELDSARRETRVHSCWMYGSLARQGAGPAELQDVAWMTYLSNVYREDGSMTHEH